MKSNQSMWAVRVFVVIAFAATVWFCGPNAAAVLAARFGGEALPGPMVVLDHVGFADRPDWLDDEMLVSIAESVSPWLSDEVGLLDEESSRRMRDGLLGTPWVHHVRVERVFPDRFRLHLSLRRPVLSVLTADAEPLCLVDETGIMLPWADCDLPKLRLYREGGAPTMPVQLGQVSDEPRVRVAAGIAKEWREELAPLVEQCPRLLEIDATNLGEHWIRGPEYPEIRVHLERVDGQPVVFGYGRAVDSTLDRVPVRRKAEVLEKILKNHDGLEELVAGDLRFSRRWADYLQPRMPGVPDPNGPWKELLPPEGR
ncbi:MAG: hypothetical protein ACI85K_000080 [Hyphomicrobiaceae bacterium]|jgi:hypothetical protein